MVAARPDLADRRRVSDADALIAVLAWERCQEMADRSKDELVRNGWLRDGQEAWAIVEKWLGKPPLISTKCDHPEDYK